MSSTNSSVGGKVSEQPKRTPITDKEMEAILVCELLHEMAIFTLHELL